MMNNEKNEGDSVVMMRERRIVFGVEKLLRNIISRHI